MRLLFLRVAFVGLLTAAIAEFASGFVSLVALLVNTQFRDYVKMIIILQLINRMSNVPQKLFKGFNGTTI